MCALASIIINNYNYGRFLREAIDSALRQSYSPVEVLVVDDGSTDNSREIIASYGQQVTPILKANGGQASAFNAGFAASRGEFVVFLDADDLLLPGALEKASALFAEPDVVKVHWPLRVVDEQGARTNQLKPSAPLPEGDLRELVIRDGPSSSGSPPTSGNAWSRQFLHKVLPVPREYRLCADDYLFALAPAYGRVGRVPEPQGYYRIHGRNNYLERDFREKLAFGLYAQEQQCLALSRLFRDRGVGVEPEVWKRKLWFHRLDRAVKDIKSHAPPQSTFILADDNEWGMGADLECRRRLFFLERDGKYWGPPEGDAAAIEELDHMRRAGADFFVFAWPAFWWLDYYTGLRQHLRSTFPCVLENDGLVMFDLRGRDAGVPTNSGRP